MNCMRCGRETQAESAFCQDCQAEMEKYPVQPGTVVLLPRRKEVPVSKKIPKRHVPTAEEQITILRKKVLFLSIVSAVMLAVILLMIRPTLHYVLDQHVEIGQNYTSVVSTVAPTTSDSTK